MAGILRLSFTRCAVAPRILQTQRIRVTGGQLQCRRFKGNSTKGSKNTANLVPGSKMPITDEVAREEYSKTEIKMQAALEWFRKDCAEGEARASGRVTPALLTPVRVKLPDSEALFRLDELATVGVRDGSTLIITLFDEDSMKHVERAIYEAKLPNLVPQRHDGRTIKIPVPKPTVEARTSLFTTAQRKAEDARVQIRKHHQASLKKGKYEKHSIELEEFQKLTDKWVGEVDKVLGDLKKSTGAKK